MVYQSELGVVEIAPEQARHRRRGGKRQDHQAADDALAGGCAVDQEGNRDAEHHFEGDSRQRELERDPDRTPEGSVMQYRPIVVEADEVPDPASGQVGKPK
ncbi:hypothetical protein [Sinorhizobium medicae]|uniref:hypothetical protein n=1 Tax=Sinorhizobium medicae TaxID=110321 RepID=UPI0027DDE952|nr:hypothetical protein [Sinorhizobium medicae]